MNSMHISFALNNIISRGAQGTVYKATRDDTEDPKQKVIAVKAVALQSDPKQRDEQVALLNQKFQDISKLSHENVIRHIIGMFDDSHNLVNLPVYYIVMEFCEGGTLHEACRYRTNVFYIRKWTKEILLGLDYLHKNKTVHRDIKGANILLDSKNLDLGRVKIADLGDIKRLLGTVTKSKEVTHRGTYAFMSPEMIANDPHTGRKTDIWSLGCTALEMLKGKVEFYKIGANGEKSLLKNEMAVLFFVGSDGGYPYIPEDCPNLLANFIKRCLTRGHTARPSAADLLNDSFITTADEEVLTWDYHDERGEPPSESYSYTSRSSQPMSQSIHARTSVS